MYQKSRIELKLFQLFIVLKKVHMLKNVFPDDEKPIHEPLTDNKNVAGITVVTILGIMVFVVIALICYAQKNTVSSTKHYYTLGTIQVLRHHDFDLF